MERVLLIQNFFQVEELFAGFDEQGVRHIARADADGVAAMLAQPVDQRTKIAVARDDHKGFELFTCEGQFKCIEGQTDVSPILAGTDAIDLDQVN